MRFIHHLVVSFCPTGSTDCSLHLCAIGQSPVALLFTQFTRAFFNSFRIAFSCSILLPSNAILSSYALCTDAQKEAPPPTFASNFLSSPSENPNSRPSLM